MALIASNRNSDFSRSLIVKSLNSDISQFAWPGPRIGIVRLMSPNVSTGAVLNAAGLM